jgi:hypothetical protein
VRRVFSYWLIAMLGCWCVGSYLEEIWLAPFLGGTAPPTGAMRIEPAVAELLVESWFPEGMASRVTLTEIVRHLEAHLIHGSAEASWLRRRVAQALRDGRLEAHALRRTIQSSAGGQKIEENKRDEPPPKPRDETTWIAIQLAYNSGKPASFERYRIKLPDGSTREGMLDASGTVRIDGIDPGMCKVSFPHYDARDWQAE